MPVPELTYPTWKSRRSSKRRPGLVRGVSIAAVILIWEMVGRASDSLSIPTFTRTASAWVELMASGRLPMALLISGISLISGLLIAILLGCTVGLALGWFRKLEQAFDVYISILLVLPMMAVAPVVIAVLGLNLASRIVIVFLFAVVIIMVNVTTGVQTVSNDLILMARSFGASNPQLFRKVLLPGASPAIVAGIRLGIGRAFVGMIAGEMLVTAVGLGYLLLEYAGLFKPHYTFATLITVIGLAAVVMALMKRVEKRLITWTQINVVD
ncbi:MAG: ABC transporter permease [Firmicutes bacterium]|nr:ABC transporter permease [Bacillota bacterium]